MTFIPSFNKKKGIALLITLVILSLVSVFVIEFFYDTSVQTRAIQNFQSSFRARSNVKSVFKAILIALQEDEENFFRYLRQIYQIVGGIPSLLHPPEPIPLPPGIIPGLDEDVVIYTPYVRPIDHLYSFSRVSGKNYKNRKDRALFNEFINIIKQIQITIPPEDPNQKPEETYLEMDDILPLYGAIYDWTDSDDNIYENEFGQIGAESGDYFDLSLEYEPKNRQLDRLSEILLIKGIQESRIPYSEWKKHFTAYQVGFESKDSVGGFAEPRININAANEEDIVFFLRRFDELTQYYDTVGPVAYVPGSTRLRPRQRFIEAAQEIAEALIQVEETEDDLLFAGVPERKFYEKMSEVSGVTTKLTGGIRNIEQKFFILYSEWYEIKVIAEVNGIQSRIDAVIHLKRDKEGKAKKHSTEIIDFLVH